MGILTWADGELPKLLVAWTLFVGFCWWQTSCFQLRPDASLVRLVAFWLIWLTSSCSLNFFDVRSFCSSFIPMFEITEIMFVPWSLIHPDFFQKEFLLVVNLLAESLVESPCLPVDSPIFFAALTFSNSLFFNDWGHLRPQVLLDEIDLSCLERSRKATTVLAQGVMGMSQHVSTCLNNTWIFGELESGMESAQIGGCIGIMYLDAWCKEPTKN